jgi:hypothetical protein
VVQVRGAVPAVSALVVGPESMVEWTGSGLTLACYDSLVFTYRLIAVSIFAISGRSSFEALLVRFQSFACVARNLPNRFDFAVGATPISFDGELVSAEYLQHILLFKSALLIRRSVFWRVIKCRIWRFALA